MGWLFFGRKKKGRKKARERAVSPSQKGARPVAPTPRPTPRTVAPPVSKPTLAEPAPAAPMPPSAPPKPEPPKPQPVRAPEPQPPVAEEIARLKLGATLVEEGAITREELRRELDSEGIGETTLAKQILAAGLPSEAELAKLFSQRYQVPQIDLADSSSSLAALEAVPVDVARTLCVLPIQKTGSILYVAAADCADREMVRELRATCGLRVKLVQCSGSEIQAALEYRYSQIAPEPEEAEEPPATEAQAIPISNRQFQARLATFQAVTLWQQTFCSGGALAAIEVDDGRPAREAVASG